jgi:hypothetical protein
MQPEILIDAAPLHISVGVGPWHLHFFPHDGFAAWSYRSSASANACRSAAADHPFGLRETRYARHARPVHAHASMGRCVRATQSRRRPRTTRSLKPPLLITRPCTTSHPTRRQSSWTNLGQERQLLTPRVSGKSCPCAFCLACSR